MIGDPSVIDKRVRIYHGVNQSTISFPGDTVEQLRGKQRHPAIGDDITVIFRFDTV